MEFWHKAGIFLVGLTGLILYLLGSVREAVTEIEREQTPKEIKVKTPQQRLLFSMLLLAGCILAMFILPPLLGKIIDFLIPDPNKFSKSLLENYLIALVYLGGHYFKDESYFFQKPGFMILEWLFVLSPYVAWVLIWSFRMLTRNIRDRF
jgi:hypothetical protein